MPAPSLVVAFDLDGTLVDDRRRYVETFEHCKRRFGLDIDPARALPLRLEGHPEAVVMRRLGVPARLASAVSAERRAVIESARLLRYQRLFPDVERGLRRLGSSRGVGIAVVTGRKHKGRLLRQLGSLSIRRHFWKVLCHSDFADKRDALEFLAGCVRLGRPRGREGRIPARAGTRSPVVYFLTDTVRDCRSASGVQGVRVVAVSRGLDSEKRLKSASPHVFGDLSRAIGFVLEGSSRSGSPVVARRP